AEHALVGVVPGGLADLDVLLDVAAGELLEGAEERLAKARRAHDDAAHHTEVALDALSLDFVPGRDQDGFVHLGTDTVRGFAGGQGLLLATRCANGDYAGKWTSRGPRSCRSARRKARTSGATGAGAAARTTQAGSAPARSRRPPSSSALAPRSCSASTWSSSACRRSSFRGGRPSTASRPPRSTP